MLFRVFFLTDCKFVLHFYTLLSFWSENCISIGLLAYFFYIFFVCLIILFNFAFD